MRVFGSLVIAAAVLAAGAAGAQVPEPTQPPPTQAPQGPQAPSEAPLGASSPSVPAPTGTGLEAQARDTVARVLPDAARSVTAEVDENGALVVRGVVPLLADKLAVNDALTELPAADILINRLVTRAPRRADAAIAREVRRRLDHAAELQGVPLEVKVEKQEVFLRGRAATALDIKAAVFAAAGVRGVRDVHTERLERALPNR
jgi:osmotically-inducible protein OsmY